MAPTATSPTTPSDAAAVSALAAMKSAEPSFNVTDFLKGARSAYEMILMAFDKGDIDRIRPFLGDDVLTPSTPPSPTARPKA